MSTTRQSAHICRRLRAAGSANIECPARRPSITSTICFVPKGFPQEMQWKGCVSLSNARLPDRGREQQARPERDGVLGTGALAQAALHAIALEEAQHRRLGAVHERGLGAGARATTGTGCTSPCRPQPRHRALPRRARSRRRALGRASRGARPRIRRPCACRSNSAKVAAAAGTAAGARETNASTACVSSPLSMNAKWRPAYPARKRSTGRARSARRGSGSTPAPPSRPRARPPGSRRARARPAAGRCRRSPRATIRAGSRAPAGRGPRRPRARAGRARRCRCGRGCRHRDRRPRGRRRAAPSAARRVGHARKLEAHRAGGTHRGAGRRIPCTGADRP